MSVIYRSACEPGGICYEMGNWKPPKNVSHVVIPHRGAPPIYVTWAEIIQKRRERQAERMFFIRDYHEERRALRIHVRYFDQFPYGGWHTYLDLAGRDGFGGRGEAHWVRGRAGDGANPYQLVTLFPMRDPIPGGLGLSEPITNYEDWMPAFAAKYQRGRHDKRPRGSLCTWAICLGTTIRNILPC